ncbi:hypothetical protein Tco_0321193 [Tanacetum coccineum]
MANLSEDIQCAGSDTRPPMLDRTDFASWQQRIRLYCQGKENGVNILKSIDEGPFQMGTFWEIGQCEDAPGRFGINQRRPRITTQHEAHANEKKMMLDGFTQHTVDPSALLSNNRDWETMERDTGAAGYGGAQNRVRNANPGQARQENGVALDEEQLLFITGGQDNAIDKDVDEQPVQDLALNVDNMFQADDCDAFDFDVDEAPMAQTMFIANLSSADPVYDEAGPSYDSDILSEVQDHDHYQDTVCEHHEEHEMHDDVQPNYVVDSHANYVKIAPPDYSKENYLATFTPQKQLTPEQIFWSQDLIKMKKEALKEQTTASRPIKALTVYPPYIPATFVPKVLPTKNQVKINIFTLIQLFSEFEKTRKKRITPTGLTEGERGFEQTKECYLTEVIPFFKTLKEHFEGIQKALTKEIKEMKDIFEELEAEVDQNIVERKHDEIERKNLLIAHDNLIADCLSKEVFYVATNSELNVSRFTEMHDAHTIVEARCLELEAELSNLWDKIQKDNYNELVK